MFNYRASTTPADAAFQMHKEVDWGGGYYRRWMKANKTVPIYMREKHEDIPMSTAYPFDEVFTLTKHIKLKNEQLKYFTSSFGWALALAILQERKVINVYGIDMADLEYVNQKDCFAFWIGFAGGRGIELNINCAENIFDKPLYGKLPLE